MKSAARELLAPPVEAAAHAGRYTFVDALRGIAALAVITTLVRIARKTNTTGPAATALWIAGACALTLIAAHLLHVTVERPTMRWASRLKGRPAAPVPVAQTISLPLVETTAAV